MSSAGAHSASLRGSGMRSEAASELSGWGGDGFAITSAPHRRREADASSTRPAVDGLPALYTPSGVHACGGQSMRTNISIDDALMRQAMQARIRSFRGRLPREGDLEAQRLYADLRDEPAVEAGSP